MLIGLAVFKPHSAVATTMAAPYAEAWLDLLRLSADQIAPLKRGEILSQTLDESTDKELAMEIALFLHAPLNRVVDHLRRGELEATDPDIVSRGEIPPEAGVEAFRHFALTAEDADEIEDLLKPEADERFNLAEGEIAGFKTLRPALAKADGQNKAQAVSLRYQEILSNRYQAYRRSGLAGIAHYTRGEGTTAVEVSMELRYAATNTEALARYRPELYKAWLNYPQNLPGGVEQSFFWENRKVENRPTAILAHRLFQASNAGAVVLIRHYYVGHSYNALNLMIGCLPYQDGTIVFYSQRTSTDQVAGTAQDLRHIIGRERMRQQMLGRLEFLRESVKTDSPQHK